MVCFVDFDLAVDAFGRKSALYRPSIVGVL
jgi:hypothetical protein